jgi:hypothetical protein
MTTRACALCLLALCLLALCVACGAVAQKKPTPPKKRERPPVAERITDNVYRIGSATVDLKARTVTCTGEINMDRGAIEYLAVAPGGKTHESLLLVRVRPLHLQVALLLLDLEPCNVLQRQGDTRRPEGDPVDILIRWRDAKGAMQEVRAEEWIARQPSGAPMPRLSWAFTGSRILKEGFEADLEKSLVAVWHDPAALLDNPLEEGSQNVYSVNAKRVPKRGSRIEFILKPAPKESAKEKREEKQ